MIKFNLIKALVLKRLFFKSLLLLTCALLLISCGDEDEPQAENPGPDPTDETIFTAGIGDARDISSFDLVAEMGVGWNLGNSFDVQSRNKTAWGNPITTKGMIDAVREMGFKTLRIPITWAHNQDNGAPYTIESEYLAEIRKVVDYGFQNKIMLSSMFIMITAGWCLRLQERRLQKSGWEVSGLRLPTTLLIIMIL